MPFPSTHVRHIMCNSSVVPSLPHLFPYQRNIQSTITLSQPFEYGLQLESEWSPLLTPCVLAQRAHERRRTSVGLFFGNVDSPTRLSSGIAFKLASFAAHRQRRCVECPSLTSWFSWSSFPPNHAALCHSTQEIRSTKNASLISFHSNARATLGVCRCQILLT